MSDDRVPSPHHSRLAFAFAVPIAVLGGQIGLGGAEFRLPVLVGPLAMPRGGPCRSTWR